MSNVLTSNEQTILREVRSELEQLRDKLYMRPKTIRFMAHMKAAQGVGITPAHDTWVATSKGFFAGRMPVYPYWVGKRKRDESGEIIDDIRYPRFWAETMQYPGQPLRVAGYWFLPIGEVPPAPKLVYNSYIGRVPAAINTPYFERWDVNLATQSGSYIDFGQSYTPDPASYFSPGSVTRREGYPEFDGGVQVYQSEYYYHIEDFLFDHFLTGAYVKNNKVYYMWNHLVTYPPFTPFNWVTLTMENRVTSAPFLFPLLVGGA